MAGVLEAVAAGDTAMLDVVAGAAATPWMAAMMMVHRRLIFHC
jgi:hypothetical protein